MCMAGRVSCSTTTELASLQSAPVQPINFLKPTFHIPRSGQAIRSRVVISRWKHKRTQSVCMSRLDAASIRTGRIAMGPRPLLGEA